MSNHKFFGETSVKAFSRIHLKWAIPVTLAHISVLPCIPLPEDSATCQSLIRTIVYVAAHFQVLNVFWTLHSITQEEMTTDRAWTAVYITRFLRNLVIHSQDSGKQAVHGAITEELVQSLPSIVSDIKIHIGNSAALETRRRIEEMWPTDRIFELRGVFRWVL